METKTSFLSVIPETAPVKIEPVSDGVRVSIPANEKITLIEQYKRNDQGPYATLSRVQLSIAPGARVTHYKVVLEGPQATHQSFLEVEAEKNTAFYSHVF